MAIELQHQGVDFLILEKADEIRRHLARQHLLRVAPATSRRTCTRSRSSPRPTGATCGRSSRRSRTTCRGGVTDKYGLRRSIAIQAPTWTARTGTTEELRWHVFSDTGQEFIAQFLVSGAGGLHIPQIPDIEGREEFAGAAFHSAQWDHSVDITGKRVAVIGTGASAIQIVPEIVKDVAELHLYQRTPPWVMPRLNNKFPQWIRRTFTYVPGTRAAMRAAIYWIHEGVGFAMTQQPRLLKIGEAMGRYNINRSIKDPELRRKLTPSYRAGCKRILNSDTYYRGIANPKTQVITESHHPDDAGRHRHRRRWRAPSRRRGVRHRLPRHRLLHLRRHQGCRRRGPGGPLEPRGDVRAPRHRRIAGCPTCSSCSVPNTALGHNSVVFMIESADPVRGPGDRRRRQGRAPGRCRPAAAPRRSSTPSCNTIWPARCSTPEVAGAGTWTTTASTAPCGAA